MYPAFLNRWRNAVSKHSSLATKRRWFWIERAAKISALLPILLLVASGPAFTQWVAQGPGPNTMGQVENITDREVVGAINAVAPHPTDANIVYVGAVNGGNWKTINAMAASPTWKRQTDSNESMSIGALEFDPTNATNQMLVAGIGRFSSFGGRGGSRTGLLRTTDGGTNWIPIDGGGTLDGINISGVAPRGNVIVISANTADNPANRGIWRSTNTGGLWTPISGGVGTGLPSGTTFDLASDPSDPTRLFTNAGANGIYRSTNTGATWTKVSDAAMDALISGSTNNIEIVVGSSNNVYVAIVNAGTLAGLFRSGNGGTTWTAMDLPATAEGGIHLGGQGGTHLSLAADPSNANIVYIGGDRQGGPFPNSIGAVDFSGRLFRGDASQPSGSQFVHLTHSNSLGPAGGGTASNSSPHADSRDMDVAANGMLIEVDDGGIYRRTTPQRNTGDWFSMNGDIQTTEFHNVAWDANSNIVIGGAQDTGTPEQLLASNTRWQSVSTADGGDVAVDDTGTPGFSTRYSSNQFLGGFRRRVYDAANVFQSQVFPALTVLGGGAALVRQFTTPIGLNNVNPARLIIGGSNGVYESLDQGNTITAIGPGIVVNSFGQDPIAYGAAGNPEMLYVGAGSRVFVRTAANPAPLIASAAYPGGLVAGLTIDPNDPQTAYVIDNANVYQTTNAGATWTVITGNLQTLKPGTLRSIAYSTSNVAGAVVVGGDNGVFIAPGSAFTPWSRLGAGLPTAPVYDLEYDAKGEILLAGTLGRGAWTFHMATPFEYAAKVVCGIQKDPKKLQLARGAYATAINIHNPNDFDVNFFKKLALTFPPSEQRPGKVMPISVDVLKPDEALEVDCEDIQRELFPSGFPSDYIKGFVVIQSSADLDVTAVYTTATVDKNGRINDHSSIDVEQIHGRRKEAPTDCCARGVSEPKRTQGLRAPAPMGEHELITLEGPGVFLSAEISKQGGANDLTFVILDIDGKNVVNFSIAAAKNLGLTQHNPFGLVLLESPVGLKTLTIGLSSPLKYNSNLTLRVNVQEAGVAQIVANIIHGK